MSTFPSLRKRQASQPVLPGAIVRIVTGDFGTGSPFAGLAQVDARASSAIYNYHEGDLFTPGTGNFVFEPIFELPLQTIWGSAMLRTPNTFNPIQPPQVYSQPTLSPNGMGGLIAGDIELYPLLNPDGESANLGSDFGYDQGIK